MIKSMSILILMSLFVVTTNASVDTKILKTEVAPFDGVLVPFDRYRTYSQEMEIERRLEKKYEERVEKKTLIYSFAIGLLIGYIAK